MLAISYYVIGFAKAVAVTTDASALYARDSSNAAKISSKDQHAPAFILFSSA
ncbi:hypothetical protein OH492_14025 [Vibrio chagasii]|nr:hypothetical protein [Vibrio chagasii]